MMKRLFWFAIGSLIAMLICFSEVYAETIPITGVSASVGLYESGGNMSFCSMLINGTNNVCEWKNGMYRYWILSVMPQSMRVGSYYNLYLNVRVIYKSRHKNPQFKDMRFCYYGNCVSGTIKEHVEDSTPKDSDGYYHFKSILELRAYYEFRNIIDNTNYFGVYFRTEETIEMITALPYNTPFFKVLTGQEAEIEANRQDAQAQINAQKEQTDKLLNSNINDNEIISKFDLFNSVLEENGTITNLMVLPITIWTTVYDSVGQECRPFELGNLLGTNLTLPCLNIENILGSTLWNTIDILFTGFFIYVISKKMILVFDKFSSLQEGDVISD